MLSSPEVLPLITTTSQAFSEAVGIGIGKRPMPASMRSMLEQNVFIFSGFKTHAELSAVSALLIGDDGKKKPFEQFARDVRAIDENYNLNYLRAEYNFATQSARSAAQWAEYQTDADQFYLQYRTAADERVRESHALLHDTTLPASDPFWQKFFPPNGWNCRCTVVQVRKSKYPLSDSKKAIANGEKATTALNKKGQNKLAIFRFNPGAEQKIFPPSHPYLPKPSQLGCKDCGENMLAYSPKNPLCKACATLKYCLKNNQVRNQEEWIADSIQRLIYGENKYKTCNVGITLGQAPDKLLKYASGKGITIKDSTMAICDENLLHSCRDSKRGLEKKIALTDEDLSKIPSLIQKSDLYFDTEKKNFLFVSRTDEKLVKLVFQQNYDHKMNGVKHTEMIQFITASYFEVYEKSWEKIN